jgi:hypothetical protein
VGESHLGGFKFLRSGPLKIERFVQLFCSKNLAVHKIFELGESKIVAGAGLGAGEY